MSSQTVQYRVILMCLFMGMGGKRRLRLGGGVWGGGLVCYLWYAIWFLGQDITWTLPCLLLHLQY